MQLGLKFKNPFDQLDPFAEGIPFGTICVLFFAGFERNNPLKNS
jgi:hypothetical protein